MSNSTQPFILRISLANKFNYYSYPFPYWSIPSTIIEIYFAPEIADSCEYWYIFFGRDFSYLPNEFAIHYVFIT